MAAAMAEVVRLNGAAAENGWEDDAREGVTYANVQKVVEHTELQRRVPQVRGPSRPWRAGQARKFLTFWVLCLGVLEGEVLDSGRQRNAAPPMDNLGSGVIRWLGGRERGCDKPPQLSQL
ncbi:hypothetical protein Emag_000003 [Eimeria magna]